MASAIHHRTGSWPAPAGGAPAARPATANRYV